jgi:Putative zinc-finger
MADRDCARLHELADELALGVLTGEERVEARTHLANCPDCREYVLELTAVSDGLLALVPGAEPPVGFEDRVLSRLGMTAGRPGDATNGASPAANQSAPITEPIPVQSQPLNHAPSDQRRGVQTMAGTGTAAAGDGTPVSELDRARARRAAGQRKRWLPLAAAAAAIALVFGFGGWAMGLNTQGSQPTPVAASGLLHGALLSADHKQLGKVWGWAGNPSWLYMDVDTTQNTGMTVTCEVQEADGTVVTIGSFTLSNGYGHWGAPAPIGKGAKARLVDGEGSVIASANLTT